MIFTLQNHPEVFWKFTPSGGYNECAVVCLSYMERSSLFIQNMSTKMGSSALILVVTGG